MTGVLILLGAALLLCLGVMMADNRRFVVRTYTVRSPKVTKTCTLVFITDLHSKVYGRDNEPVLAAIRAAKPDAVVFGGDVIVAAQATNRGAAWMETSLRLLRAVAAEYPVFFVNGNHESKLDQTFWNEDEADNLYANSVCGTEAGGKNAFHGAEAGGQSAPCDVARKGKSGSHGGRRKRDERDERRRRERRAQYAGTYEMWTRALREIGVCPVRNGRLRLENGRFVPISDENAGGESHGAAPVQGTAAENLGAASGQSAVAESHGAAPPPGVADGNLDFFGLELDGRLYAKGRREALTAEDVERLLGRPDPTRFTVLTAHSPRYFATYAAWGADLVLSGHIHGGIVRLPLLGGVISPYLTLFPRYSGGRYELPKGGDGSRAVMILSCGLGMHTLPVRLFNPAELSVIHIEPL